MTTVSSHIRTTGRLAFPIVVGQVGHMMMGIVDSVMVGHIGAEPLAAASLSNGLFFLILVMGLGVTQAITPLTAMEKGAGQPARCGVVLRQGLLATLAMALILAGVVIGGAKLVPHLGQPELVVANAVPYLSILGWSVFPMMIFQAYRQYTEGLSVMKPAMTINLLANLANAFFNWMFIFGNLGAPEMGLAGAGVATFLTRSMMAVSLIAYVNLAPRFKQFDPSLRFRTLDWFLMKRIVQLGLASGFQYTFEVSAFAGAAVIIGWMGANELAAHQIALNLAALTYMFTIGVSTAGSVRVGEAVGANRIDEARKAGFSAVILAAAIMGSFAVIFILTRHLLPWLYIDDPDVHRLAAGLLLIAAMFQVSDGIQGVGLGILRGMADTRIPTGITLIAYWIVGLPAGYLMGFSGGMGANGVWFGLLIALTTSGALLLFRFHWLTQPGRSGIHRQNIG